MKVTGREKVILGVMAGAVIWGASIMIPSLGKRSEPGAASARMAEVQQFIAGFGTLLQEQAPPAKILYAIQAAEAEWSGDPFNEIHQEAAATPAPAIKPADGFNYSGYLEMGNHRLAVINDLEYETGELLKEKGYKVKQISPSRVVVQSVPEGKEIIINMQGTSEPRPNGAEALVLVLPEQANPATPNRSGVQQGNISRETRPSPRLQTLDTRNNGGKTDNNRIGHGTHIAAQLFPDDGICREEAAVCFVNDTHYGRYLGNAGQ